MALRDLLYAAGGAAIGLGELVGGPIGAAIVAGTAAQPLFDAAESVARIGPGHNIGDAIADVLNNLSEAGHPELVGDALAAIIGTEQPTSLPDPAGGAPLPWRVKGTRYEIADFFDYEHDCFRGDSVEIFLPADDHLAAHIDEILGLFATLREAGVFAGAYISIRFMAQGSALLSPQRWPMTCSIEVSALRGLLGSFDLLRRIEQLTLEPAAPSTGAS